MTSVSWCSGARFGFSRYDGSNAHFMILLHTHSAHLLLCQKQFPFYNYYEYHLDL
jgi:hypothetical protein